MQRTLESVRLFDEIAERGYAEFEHGISSDQIELAVERYTQFTLAHPDPSFETMSAMLPDIDDVSVLAKSLDDLDRSQDTQTEWHKYRTNMPKIGKPDGYTNRSFQEQALGETRGIAIPHEDPKEFYHFAPDLTHRVQQAHEAFQWGTIPPEVYRLNDAFLPIHAKATQLILRVCGLIEELHPEIRDFITPASLKTSPIRLLFYHPDDQPMLGAGHYDKSGLTAQLAESHTGLRVAPNEHEDLHDVVRDGSKAVVFPGDNLSKKIPGTILLPGWHDIVRTNQLNPGRSIPEQVQKACVRWAMIFFANEENYIPPDKSLMHTR